MPLPSQEIAMFGKVTDIHVDYIPTGSCVDRVTLVFCLQIAENFSEDLHGTANLINKVVTICVPVWSIALIPLPVYAAITIIQHNHPKYQIAACM